VVVSDAKGGDLKWLDSQVAINEMGLKPKGIPFLIFLFFIHIHKKGLLAYLIFVFSLQIFLLL